MVKKILWVGGWCVWITVCYFLAQALVVAVWWVLGLDASTNDALPSTLLTAGIYGLMLALSFGGAYLVRKHLELPKVAELMALTRQIKWRDVGQAVLYALAYFGVLVVVMVAFQMLFPELANQEQDIGFAKTGNDWWQLVLIFIALVIIAPVAEELTMRGLLFGRLRAKISFWPTTIIVSLLFALAHWQINVGIDVFILSLFLCYVREKTGAIYAPVMIHILKNLVGFLALFVWAF